MIASIHHQNDDLWALGVCLAIGAVALSGTMALIHQPAVQALIEGTAHFVSQQVPGAYPHLPPVK